MSFLSLLIYLMHHCSIKQNVTDPKLFEKYMHCKRHMAFWVILQQRA